MKLAGIFFLILVLTSCASGSAIIVGEKRAPIEDWESVAVVRQMPEGAVEIAIVSASSDAGFTKQQDVDYAVAELKKQAAKVGANTVVIGKTATAKGVASMPNYQTGGSTVYSTSEELVEGLAVYVAR